MWWIGPMWSKCAFGDQKGLIQKKRHAIWQSPSSLDKKLPSFHKNYRCILFFITMGQKVVFWVKKRCFGVSWTGCEVTDLKPRQGITKMDHRNKIQLFVLPTDDPGDAPGCMCEYGPCTCEYGRMCHTAPTAQECGIFLQSKLHLALMVRLEPSNSMPATKYGQQHSTAESTPVGPKKRSKNKNSFE